MGKKIFKPPTMESILSAKHDDHVFFSSKLSDRKMLWVGKNCDDLYQTLLQFDISSLPFNLTLVKSTLNLLLSFNAFPDTRKTIEAFQILSGWNQEKICWKKHPLTGSTPAASASITTPPGTFVRLDLTVLAERWYTGQAANFGILLKMADKPANNLVAFASGKVYNSNVWPYLEISFTSSGSGGGHDTLDISLGMTTADAANFTAPVNILLYSYTYLIVNNGSYGAFVYLEVSPDGSTWQRQTEVTAVNPGQLVTLVSDTIAKFSRLGYQSAHPGKSTHLSTYIQGLS